MFDIPAQSNNNNNNFAVSLTLSHISFICSRCIFQVMGIRNPQKFFIFGGENPKKLTPTEITCYMVSHEEPPHIGGLYQGATTSAFNEMM